MFFSPPAIQYWNTTLLWLFFFAHVRMYVRTYGMYRAVCFFPLVVFLPLLSPENIFRTPVPSWCRVQDFGSVKDQ